MTRKTIKLDEKDRKIISLLHDNQDISQEEISWISLLHDNQDISQEEIANVIHLSQPSVAMRLKKLKENGIMESIIGVNLNKVGIYVAVVIVRTTNTTNARTIIIKVLTVNSTPFLFIIVV